MKNNLFLNFSRDDDSLLVMMDGDLDISSSPKFTEAIEEEYEKENSNIVFDMAKLEYIDSTGIGAFMTIYKKIKDSQYSMEIINAKENIKKIFKITELDRLFRME